MRNLRLDICYDGTRYRGWQRLPNCEETIQGKLERVLSKILDEPIEITGSGRTDAGVHALHQIANFRCCSGMPCSEILAQLHRYLPEDIGIYSVKDVSERFHARLNAKKKTYRYNLWVDDSPCVFERRYVSIYPCVLNLEAMNQAASIMIGTHDFSAFCANKHFKKSTIRTIYSIQIEANPHSFIFSITGNGFLHNMVRIIVGTLVEVGEGKRDPESIHTLFGAPRSDSGMLMSSKGLCLMEVEY